MHVDGFASVWNGKGEDMDMEDLLDLYETTSTSHSHFLYQQDLPPCSFKGDKYRLLNFPHMPKLCVIGAEVCSGCENLTDLPNMPELMSIDHSAFENSGLTTLSDMPKLLTINDAAFRDCKLKSVALKSIQVIGDEAFKGNQELETLQLPPCIKYIGTDAFADCPKLTKVVVEGVETVKMLICKCERLRELLIGKAGLKHPLVYVGGSHRGDDYYHTGMLTGLVRSFPQVIRSRRIQL